VDYIVSLATTPQNAATLLPVLQAFLPRQFWHDQGRPISRAGIDLRNFLGDRNIPSLNLQRQELPDKIEGVHLRVWGKAHESGGTRLGPPALEMQYGGRRLLFLPPLGAEGRTRLASGVVDENFEAVWLTAWRGKEAAWDELLSVIKPRLVIVCGDVDNRQTATSRPGSEWRWTSQGAVEVKVSPAGWTVRQTGN
jgi:hypothetical protein